MKRVQIGLLWLVPLLAMGFVPGCCATPHERDMHAARAEPAAVAGHAFINAHAIVIFRHADISVATKATMGNATPLLPAGEVRAKEIITALHSAGVTRVLTSPALRTQETATPLAESLHVKVENAGATADEVLKYLATTAKPGETIVLVHHHSVIPAILAGFGVEKESLAEDATEFDRVYVILPDAAKGTYEVLRLRYGGKWE